MLTKQEQEAYMRMCIELAILAKESGEVPVGALVIKDGEIVGKGQNRRQLDCDPSAHAEVIAMREAGKRLGVWNLSGCELVVSLEPCAMCAGTAMNARIDHIYFGAFDKRFGYCGSVGNSACDERLNHRCGITGGILEKECVEPLRAFFKERR